MQKPAAQDSVFMPSQRPGRPTRSPRFDRRRFLERLGLAAGAPLLYPVARSLVSEAYGAPGRRRCAVIVVVGENIPVTAPEGFMPPGVARFGGDKPQVETPTMFQPLRPYWSRMVIVDAANTVAGPCQHGMGFSCLSGLDVEGGTPEFGGKPRGPSLDHHIASVIGKETPLPSLLIGANGGGDYATTTFSSGRLQPVPHILRPSIVYQQLLGKRATGEASAPTVDAGAALLRKRVLDTMRHDVKRLAAELAGPERQRLEVYLSSIESFDKRQEEQIRLLQSADCSKPPQPGADGKEGNGPERVALMLRMATLALRCGLTNVVGLSVGHGFGHDDLGVMGPVLPWRGYGGHGPNEVYNQSLNRIYRHISGLLAELIVGVGPLAEGLVMMVVPGTSARDSLHHHDGNSGMALIHDGTGTLRTGGRYFGPARGSRSLMDAYCAVAHAAGAPTSSFGAGEKNRVTGPMPELMA
jgi:hypothetical protein